MFDWFTIVAQLLNFLLLIWLLKRFLYQPILNALDARERRISNELATADQKILQAQAERDEFLRKNQEFDQQRLELFKQVAEEAKLEKQRLLNQTRQEIDAFRTQQQHALKNQQQDLINSISRQTQAQVFAITRQLLTDLAGVNLEAHIVTVFIEKLQSINADEKQRILIAAKNPTTPLSIRTAFALSPGQQMQLTQAVQKIFALETELEFTVGPHLISGIELSSDGEKFSWGVTNYLTALEKNLHAVLQTHVEEKSISDLQADNHDS